jgi:hypothetical protein
LPPNDSWVPALAVLPRFPLSVFVKFMQKHERSCLSTAQQGGVSIQEAVAQRVIQEWGLIYASGVDDAPPWTASFSNLRSVHQRAAAITTSYDARHCSNDADGHCNGDTGGGWTYRRRDGSCRHTEANVPRAHDVVKALPRLFSDVHSVIDFGGGPGGYLTGFRDRGVPGPLVTVEPHELGPCLFRGITQVVPKAFGERANRTS